MGIAAGQESVPGQTLAKQLGCYNCHLGGVEANPFYGKIQSCSTAVSDTARITYTAYLDGQSGRLVGTAARMPVFALSQAERNALTDYLLRRVSGLKISMVRERSGQ